MGKNDNDPLNEFLYVHNIRYSNAGPGYLSDLWSAMFYIKTKLEEIDSKLSDERGTACCPKCGLELKVILKEKP